MIKNSEKSIKIYVMNSLLIDDANFVTFFTRGCFVAPRAEITTFATNGFLSPRHAQQVKTWHSVHFWTRPLISHFRSNKAEK